MLDWLKNINKEFPDFWKTYLAKFDEKPSRFVVLSTESSGLQPEKDVLLSIGSFAIIDNSIVIGDSFEVLFLQYTYLHDNGLSNEFLLGSKIKKMSERDAIESFVEYIGNAVLVGHKIDFELDIINAALERLDCGRLKNEALDVDVMYGKLVDSNDKQYPLDDLLEIFKIPNTHRKSPSEDAYKIGLLFLRLKGRLGIK